VTIAAVWLGGMIGAWARYHVTRHVYARTGSGFPWVTLVVNVTGSLALGVLLPLLAAAATLHSVRGFITVGVLGSFTTFSTFALETVTLVQDGRWRHAAAYAAASVVLGVGALATGVLAARLLT
jgi:fluoride exporter